MEIQNLTEEEINVMVAQAAGWRPCQCGKPDCWTPPSVLNGDAYNGEPIQFSNSLDACATFEANIPDRRVYTMRLDESVREDFPDWQIMGLEDRYFEVVTATPRQRCIAFLRMKGVL